MLETPAYHKLLFVGDVAVIPAPDFKQKQIIMGELVKVAKSAGISLPKVAIIAATEQVLPSQPATMEASSFALCTIVNNATSTPSSAHAAAIIS